ncbi:MAG: hypothetical protein ACTHNT_13665 [Actinomycetales bacterium]
MPSRQPLDQLRRRLLRPSNGATTQTPTASPGGGVAALQRSVGNRATVGVLSAPTIRRDTDNGELTDTVDLLAGQASHWGGGAGFGMMPNAQGQMDYAYKYGNTTTTGAEGGATTAFMGTLTAGIGTVTSAVKAEKARKTMKEESEAGRGGQGTHRDASRTHKTNSANAVQNAGLTVSTALSGTSGVSQVLANSGATSTFAASNNIFGGVAGVVALPVQAFQTLRTARKAYKQWQRVKALGTNFVDPKVSEKELAKKFDDLKKVKAESEATLTAMKSDRDEAKSKLAGLENKKKTGSGWSSDDNAALMALQQQVPQLDAGVDDWEKRVADVTADVDNAEKAKDAAVAKLVEVQQRKDNKEENADDIRAYALRKNQSGFFKKITSVVGGLLGIGGGIAATVAAFAAIGATTVVATAALATPVGWALCGAAALIGLALGGYALVKWAKKRYEQLREENPGMSKGKAFLSAINPFKKVPNGERERLSKRLYNYATGQVPGAAPDEQQKAVDTIKALGLDFAALKLDDPTHQDAAVKLIMAKMAS